MFLMFFLICVFSEYCVLSLVVAASLLLKDWGILQKIRGDVEEAETMNFEGVATGFCFAFPDVWFGLVIH